MNNMKDAVSKFLASQGPFHLAVTVNLKKRHHKHHINNSLELAEKSGYWLIDRLNDSVLRRKYRFKKEQLNSICAIEKGSIEKRFHLHLAIGVPANISVYEFIGKLKKVHRKMEWAYGEPHISKYINDGWIDYISKEGFDSVLL
jgi:hypothetical protein